MIIASPKPAIKTQTDFMSPFMLGCMDSEDGEPFAPEFYFVWEGDMLAYTGGFESISGESYITLSFKNKILGKPTLTDAQIEAEFADLVEGMSDEQFWSRGQW